MYRLYNSKNKLIYIIMNQTLYWKKLGTQDTVWFYLYRVKEYAKLINSIRNQNSGYPEGMGLTGEQYKKPSGCWFHAYAYIICKNLAVYLSVLYRL